MCGGIPHMLPYPEQNHAHKFRGVDSPRRVWGPPQKREGKDSLKSNKEIDKNCKLSSGIRCYRANTVEQV